jgi:hypothetical protein
VSTVERVRALFVSMPLPTNNFWQSANIVAGKEYIGPTTMLLHIYDAHIFTHEHESEQVDLRKDLVLIPTPAMTRLWTFSGNIG